MIDVNSFNHWFSVLDWDRSIEEMVETIYQEVITKPILDKTTGANVALKTMRDKFHKTFQNNQYLLSLDLHPRLKDLGAKQQAFVVMVLARLDHDPATAGRYSPSIQG
jgi:hypothetical protein